MSRVSDLLEAWSKDPAYSHDLATLARDLRLGRPKDVGASPGARVVELAGKTKPSPAPSRSRRKAKIA